MKFDKELGMRRLNKFFGGIGKAINNVIKKIKDYQDKEEERTQAKMDKLDRQISIQKKVNEMERLKNELKKQRNSENRNGSVINETLEALGQQKIFSDEGYIQSNQKNNKTKKQTFSQPSLDDGYTGMFKGG